MKNLTLENITKACRGTYHGDPKKLGMEVLDVVHSVSFHPVLGVQL